MQQKLLMILVFITLGVVLANCSSENASWMKNSSSLISHKKITQITLPGAHLANAYNISKKSTLCSGELSINGMSNNGHIMQQLDENGASSIENDIFIATLNTQDSDILQQLKQGTRYLELSICQQESTYYTSNLYLTDELSKVSSQITTFIHEHPSEIIIIDLDDNLRFEEGFMDNQAIALLHNTLVKEFGNSLTPNNKIESTINELIANHYQIILLSSNSTLSSYPDVWNKNNIAFSADAAYPIIKKISLLDAYFANTTNYASDKFNILPVYSEISYDVLNPEIYEADQDQEIILNYLEHHVGSHPSIIVSTHNNARQINQLIVEQTQQLAELAPSFESTLAPQLESNIKIDKTESALEIKLNSKVTESLPQINIF